MVHSPDFSMAPPWPVRWALGAPLAAAAGLWFYAEVWGVPWHGYSMAAVVAMAWVCALAGQWSVWRDGRERKAAWAVLVVVAALAVYWAGWRLPRGLVLASTPVVVLAAFQWVLGIGPRHPWLLRAAVVLGSAVALLTVLSFPLERVAPGLGVLGQGLRALVVAALVIGAATLWVEAPRLRISEATLRLARSLLFAAGVWLPMVWWRSEGVLSEFKRPENAAFLGLVLLVAWARPGKGGDGGRSERSAVRAAAWLFAVLVAGLAFSMRDPSGLAAPARILSGVAMSAAALGSLLWWPWRPGQPPPMLAWFPEVVFVVLLAVAVTVPR